MFEPDDTPTKKSTTKASSHMDGTRSLERLRDRVDLAVKELRRLREENGALRKELAAARKTKTAPEDGSTIHFNESPGELRKQVQVLIDVLDDHIEQAHGSNDS